MLPDGTFRGCTSEQLLASAFGNGDDGVGSLFEAFFQRRKAGRLVSTLVVKDMIHIN
jgi:hypothetical protein